MPTYPAPSSEVSALSQGVAHAAPSETRCRRKTRCAVLGRLKARTEPSEGPAHSVSTNTTAASGAAHAVPSESPLPSEGSVPSQSAAHGLSS